MAKQKPQQAIPPASNIPKPPPPPPLLRQSGNSPLPGKAGPSGIAATVPPSLFNRSIGSRVWSMARNYRPSLIVIVAGTIVAAMLFVFLWPWHSDTDPPKPISASSAVANSIREYLRVESNLDPSKLADAEWYSPLRVQLGHADVLAVRCKYRESGSLQDVSFLMVDDKPKGFVQTSDLWPHWFPEMGIGPSGKPLEPNLLWFSVATTDDWAGRSAETRMGWFGGGSYYRGYAVIVGAQLIEHLRTGAFRNGAPRKLIRKYGPQGPGASDAIEKLISAKGPYIDDLIVMLRRFRLHSTFDRFDSVREDIRWQVKQSKGLSWRVHLLKYGSDDDEKLYSRFHLDEPWDSEHNAKLIPSMPEIYNYPGTKNDGRTFISRATGYDSAVEKRRGEILIESIPIPWTKPSDWKFNPDDLLADTRVDKRGITFAVVSWHPGVIQITDEITSEQLIKMFEGKFPERKYGEIRE